VRVNTVRRGAALNTTCCATVYLAVLGEQLQSLDLLCDIGNLITIHKLKHIYLSAEANHTFRVYTVLQIVFEVNLASLEQSGSGDRSACCFVPTALEFSQDLLIMYE
jgi:hypothetical protein